MNNIDELIKRLPRKKSLLEMACYQGADLPKKWIREMGEYCKGYNKCLEDVVAVLQIYAREQVVSDQCSELETQTPIQKRDVS